MAAAAAGVISVCSLHFWRAQRSNLKYNPRKSSFPVFEGDSSSERYLWKQVNGARGNDDRQTAAWTNGISWSTCQRSVHTAHYMHGRQQAINEQHSSTICSNSKRPPTQLDGLLMCRCYIFWAKRNSYTGWSRKEAPAERNKQTVLKTSNKARFLSQIRVRKKH